MSISSVAAKTRVEDEDHEHFESSTVYGSAMAGKELPRFELPEHEMDSKAAYRFVHDELLLDSSPALNLASFVTTYMEDEVERLMVEHLNVNLVDYEEYPGTAEVEKRCVNIVANLFHAPRENDQAEALGVSTVGSSEGIILAVLAAKKRWQAWRKSQGKSTDKPNIVMNSAVQVCWEKAARYLDVEEKYWFCAPGKYVIDPEEAAALVDENTILVCAILGTTYTGQYEDVQGLDAALEKRNKELGTQVRIHVDAASGGFVAPFVNPGLVWDFRLPNVCSIQASGHKYGLCYAGVGWCIFRDKSYVPDEICFTINYLGAPQVSLTLNFSKSAVQVIAQYYQFLRLGKHGYRAIMINLTKTADFLAQVIGEMHDGIFEILSETKGKGLPLVAWKLKDQSGAIGYDEFAIAAHLRQSGWVVPAYTMAPHTEQMKLLRVVVREDFSRSRCDAFIRDLKNTITYLGKAPAAVKEHLSEGHIAPVKKMHTKHHNKPLAHAGRHHNLQGKTGKTHAIC